MNYESCGVIAGRSNNLSGDDMNGETHGAGAVASWSIAALFLQPDLPMLALGLPVAVIAAGFPDSWNPTLYFVKVKTFEGHRGVSHWLLTCLLTTALIYGRSFDLACFWLAGYLSHLVLDLFTGGGYYLFGPLPVMIGTSLARNGEWLDTLLSKVLLGVPLVCLVLSVLK